MGAIIGLKANSEISLPITGGKYLTLKTDEFLIFDAVDNNAGKAYVIHLNVNRIQDSAKLEMPATSDVEKMLILYRNCGDITVYNTNDELSKAMQEVRNNAKENEAQKKAVEQAKAVMQTQTQTSSSTNKENLAKCFAVAGLICLGLYCIAKK